MCVVSMISDDWQRRAGDVWPDLFPNHTPYRPSPSQIPAEFFSRISREEFDALKKEVQELKKLLEAAKKYDDATGQPDCEVEEKTALFKKLAELVGVDLSSVFPEAK